MAKTIRSWSASLAVAGAAQSERAARVTVQSPTLPVRRIVNMINMTALTVAESNATR